MAAERAAQRCASHHIDVAREFVAGDVGTISGANKRGTDQRARNGSSDELDISVQAVRGRVSGPRGVAKGFHGNYRMTQQLSAAFTGTKAEVPGIGDA